MKVLTTLFLLLSTNVSANIFIEKAVDITHTKAVYDNYYYDTTEHNATITIGYTSNSVEISSTYIESKYMDNTFDLNVSYNTNVADNIKLSTGITLVDKYYYYSDIVVDNLSVLPELGLSYIEFDNVQPSIKVDSNKNISAAIRFLF